MQAPDPNAKEYRSLVGVPDQVGLAVGAMIEETALAYTANNDHYSIRDGVTYGKNLDNFMGQVVRVKCGQTGQAAPNPLPHITPGYKFNDCNLVASSTCFYIGNGLIITAGHAVFDGHGAVVKPTVPGMKVVFGLTNANCNNKTIPAAKVFGIDRVVFGQDELFPPGQLGSDRADWAIVKLAVNPASPNLPPPLALRKWAFGEMIKGAWTIGHPWGIGLTLSRPADNKGEVTIRGTNALEHNLYVAQGNSGSPLLSKENEIIGIVASGLGDPIVGRGFWWLAGSEILPFIDPNQKFYATKTNICRSLTHTDVACFFGCQLPNVQAHLVVEILFGDGPNEASWASRQIINQATNPNDRLQILIDYQTIQGPANPAPVNPAPPVFKPWLIRAIQFTLTHAGGGGGLVQGPQGLQIPRIPALIFGCMDAGDQGKPDNWTILLSQIDFPYQPGYPNPVECPIFLQKNWKTIANNRLGPLDLTAWEAPTRPRK